MAKRQKVRRFYRLPYWIVEELEDIKKSTGLTETAIVERSLEFGLITFRRWLANNGSKNKQAREELSWVSMSKPYTTSPRSIAKAKEEGAEESLDELLQQLDEFPNKEG